MAAAWLAAFAFSILVAGVTVGILLDYTFRRWAMTRRYVLGLSG